MEMESIRILNDGSRFYIVIENPSEEAKKAAIEFVAERLGIGRTIQEEIPEGVLPVSVINYEIPDNIPKITELMEPDVPNITNTKLFVEWWMKYDKLTETMKKALDSNFRMFMMNYLKKVHRSEKKEIEMFLVEFEPIFDNTIRKILKKNGYNNLKAFLSTENESNIQAAYDVCKNGICSILNIK